MMRSRVVAAAWLVLATTASATRAQEIRSDEPLIVVAGRGEAKRPPDYAVLSISLFGEGARPGDAARALTAAQTRVSEGLASMNGVEASDIRTEELELSAILPTGCDEDNYEDSPPPRPSRCDPRAYAASLPMTVKVSPAARAGDAISLATQLGARGANIDEFKVADPAALRREASRKAFEDARDQAQRLATTAGRKLGPLVRLTYGGYGNGDPGDVEEVVVTGSRRRENLISPEVPVNLTPEDVTESETITAHFRIE